MLLSIISAVIITWLISFLPGVENLRSEFTDYVIDQDLSPPIEDWPTSDLRDYPVIKTYIWRNGDIFKSWYDPIKDDSSQIKALIIAEKYVQRLRLNEPR